ncbi:DEAD/DEAH box helicase [Clostridium perfringens]|nr:DEAD/DEAH box helicase [Clostridium perfringens]
MVNLKLKWISDVIGKDYKQWKDGDIIKIQAQTGTGKTRFIIGDKNNRGLVDNMNCFEKMIYICNRTELKRQVKLDLLKKYNKKIEYINKEEKQVDTEWLDKQTVIENVTIATYHAIAEGKLDNIYLNKDNSLDFYKYIVCDECHFFLTDSSYMNKTYLAFKELIQKSYNKSIRIFISATMQEVSNTIDKSFENNNEKVLGRKKEIHEYTSNIDYSYLNVKYFKKLETDVYQLIKNDNTDDKWLIFVTSKEKGQALKEKLNDNNITSDFIHSSKKSIEKENILNTGTFKTKVLITTKCLDNGVNIKDDKVKNLVILAYDKVTFIQELGRKRFNILNAPIINLYIPMLSVKSFNTLLHRQGKKFNDLDLYKDNIEAFKRKYNDNTNYPKDLFHLNKDMEYTVNLLGYARLFNDNTFCKDIRNKLYNDEFAYIKEQLSWLGLEDTFDKNDLIEDVVDIEDIERLEDFLEKAYNNNEKFTKEYFTETINKIIEKDSRMKKVLNEIDNRKNRKKGMKIYNKLFDKLQINYVVGSKVKKETIDGKRKNITHWIVLCVKDN